MEADAARQSSITDEQMQFFLDNGFLVIRNIVKGKELGFIQAETMRLIEAGTSHEESTSDYFYGKGLKSGKKVLKRIEYLIDKSDALKVLLAHPFILSSVERVQGGASFRPGI